jgi:hypothetical protein
VTTTRAPLPRCPVRRPGANTVPLGMILVLGLVAALPVALALVPSETLHGDMGAGAGSGDLCAAALSSLDHDLQNSRALPGADNQAVLVFLDIGVLGHEETTIPGAWLRAEAERPGSCTAGTTGASHPLLL